MCWGVIATTPVRGWVAALLGRVRKKVAQLFQPGHDIGQMDPQSATTPLRQNLEVSPSLCRLYDSECVLLSWHRQVDAVITGDLEEYAAVRAALVGLASRMQEPWPESNTSGDSFAISNAVPHFLQVRFVLLVHLY